MVVRGLDRETFHCRPDDGQDSTHGVSIVRGQCRRDDDAEFEPLATFFQLDSLALILPVVDVADLDAPRKNLPVVPLILPGNLQSAVDDQFDTDGPGHPGFVHDDLELPVEYRILLWLLNLVDDPFAQNFEFGLGRVDENDRLGHMQLQMTLMRDLARRSRPLTGRRRGVLREMRLDRSMVLLISPVSETEQGRIPSDVLGTSRSVCALRAVSQGSSERGHRTRWKMYGRLSRQSARWIGVIFGCRFFVHYCLTCSTEAISDANYAALPDFPTAGVDLERLVWDDTVYDCCPCQV